MHKPTAQGAHRFWLLVAVLVALLVTTGRPVRAALDDVTGHWAEESVHWLVAKGVVVGFPDRLYRPDWSVTRAEFAKMLICALGYEEEAEVARRAPSRFRDVPSDHWARGYVEVAADLGWVEGYGDDLFKPNGLILRSEMAVMIGKALGLQPAEGLPVPFADSAAIPAWATGYVAALAQRGLLRGYEDGTFRPLRHTTRAEAAVLILRLLREVGRDADLFGELTWVDPDHSRIRLALATDQVEIAIAGRGIFRAGRRADLSALKVGDQVAVVLGPGGRAVFVSASFADAVAWDVTVDRLSQTISFAEGAETRQIPILPDADLYLNGRSVGWDALPDAAGRAYMVFDVRTGWIRILDLAVFDVVGVIRHVRLEERHLVVEVAEGLETIIAAPEVLVFLNGEPAELDSLQAGDTAKVGLNEQGLADYVEAERKR